MGNGASTNSGNNAENLPKPKPKPLVFVPPTEAEMEWANKTAELTDKDFEKSTEKNAQNEAADAPKEAEPKISTNETTAAVKEEGAIANSEQLNEVIKDDQGAKIAVEEKSSGALETKENAIEGKVETGESKLIDSDNGTSVPVETNASDANATDIYYDENGVAYTADGYPYDSTGDQAAAYGESQPEQGEITDAVGGVEGEQYYEAEGVWYRITYSEEGEAIYTPLEYDPNAVGEGEATVGTEGAGGEYAVEGTEGVDVEAPVEEDPVLVAEREAREAEVKADPYCSWRAFVAVAELNMDDVRRIVSSAQEIVEQVRVCVSNPPCVR